MSNNDLVGMDIPEDKTNNIKIKAASKLKNNAHLPEKLGKYIITRCRKCKKC